MATTSPLHTATGDDGGQDGVDLQDTLSTRNAYDTEDKHEMEDASGTEPHNKKESRGIKVIRGTKGPMQAVLDTTELLELIALHLSTKDLTSTLTVSKHWQATILGSIALRRNLFLGSVPIQEHLDWVKEDGEEHLPFLCSEPTETSLRVVKLHPIFSDRRRHSDAPLSDEEQRQMNPYIEFGRVPCASLRTIHPSTLLLQPPLEEMSVSFQPRAMFFSFPVDIKRTGGVTFGDLLEQWEKLREGSARMKKQREETCSIAIVNAISIDADAVKFALGTLSKAKYAAGVKELDTGYIFGDWEIS